MADVHLRAKMFLSETGATRYGGKVVLSVVTRGEDNKAWAASTPTGKLELGITGAARVAELFPLEDLEAGQEYFITIEKVPESHIGREGMTVDE